MNHIYHLNQQMRATNTGEPEIGRVMSLTLSPSSSCRKEMKSHGHECSLSGKQRQQIEIVSNNDDDDDGDGEDSNWRQRININQVQKNYKDEILRYSSEVGSLLITYSIRCKSFDIAFFTKSFFLHPFQLIWFPKSHSFHHITSHNSYIFETQSCIVFFSSGEKKRA